MDMQTLSLFADDSVEFLPDSETSYLPVSQTDAVKLAQIVNSIKFGNFLLPSLSGHVPSQLMLPNFLLPPHLASLTTEI